MTSESFQPIQGMSDLAPPEIYLWQRLEETARDILHRYSFREVRTPVLERTDVFTRSLGDATDVVQKEMYSFADRGGRDLTLRPEGTAGVIRFVAGQGQDAQDARLYYIGPMFRSERPQAGRRRQFHQLGVEAIGAPSPAADVEVIALQAHLLTAWGLKDFRMELNTRGAPGDQERVTAGLRSALASSQSVLCADCRRRYEQNPLRILDCKNETCRETVAQLPPVTDFMSPEARAYLDTVADMLERLEIPVTRNPRLVRGLDYYVHTVWEVTHMGLGAQDAVSGGGRYTLTLGNKTIEGVGFAMGLERVITALAGQGVKAADLEAPPVVWLVAQGDAAFEENLILMQSLRMRGVACGMDLQGRSMKAQMRAAHRTRSRYVIIRGDQEMERGTFQLKHMEDGTQEELDMPDLMKRLMPAKGLAISDTEEE
jgi:histidyl-tRNA synthetase